MDRMLVVLITLSVAALIFGLWLAFVWAAESGRLRKSWKILAVPLRWISGLFTTLISFSYLRRVLERCPACGCRVKEMKFSEDARVAGSPNEQGMLLMRCVACGAKWLNRPDYPWSEWAVRVSDREFEREKE